MFIIKLKKGFTLIELLVVIAIIAILAAILFPVFAQAREKARQTSCLSNLKNIGTAIILYTDDNHETYPMAFCNVGGDTYKHYWPAKLYPYTKDWKIYYCPSHWNTYNKDLPDDNTYDKPCQGNSALSGGYTANPNMMGNQGTTNAVKAARVKSPSNCVVIYEGCSWGCDDIGWGNNGSHRWGHLPGAGLAGQTPSNDLTAEEKEDFNNGRHNEGINLCYADGHAGFEKSVTVWNWKFLDKKNPFRPTTW